MRLFALCFIPLLTALAAAGCPEVEVQEGFNLNRYISAPWYVQEQAVVDYQPREQFYCVRARYSRVGGWSKRTFWGYTINVNNQAQDASGESFGGRLCAYQTKKNPAKLAVAPCFLPRAAAGPYWVVAYKEGKDGYALVSGGQPTIESKPGLCRTGDGINNSGLWIFTRAKARNQTVVNTVRQIARNKGFDLSVLFNVTQTGCVYN